MIKRTLIAAIISLFFVSHANAWEKEAYVESSQSGNGIDVIAPKDTIKHHSIGIEYNFFTLTDLGVALSHLFDDKCEKTFECSYGAISLNYGYLFYNVETGIIANISISDNPLFSLMGKIKLNGSDPGSFVNPFFEIDLGVAFTEKNFSPIGHISLLGFEIGYPVSFRFQVPFLLWGQRGLTYIGVAYRF